MRLTKHLALGGFAAVLTVAVLAAGCSKSSTPTTTTTSTTTTTPTTLPPTTLTTTTSSTTTSTTQPAPPPTCISTQLKLVALQGSGAAGTIYSPVEVENISTAACSLDGRPGITLIGAMQGAQPAPLTTTVQNTGEESVFSIPPTLLTLPPTGAPEVGFLVQSSDVPVDGEQACPVVTSMSVKLPSVSSPLPVKETFTACGGPTVSVSAIVGASSIETG